jgi:hypothetical protein
MLFNTARTSLLLLVAVVLLAFILAVNYLSYQTCIPMSPSRTRCVAGQTDSASTLTVEEAIALGFPVYLPSSTVLASRNVKASPVVTIDSYDSTCSYIQLDFYPQIETERSVYRMYISNGCAFPTLNVYDGPVLQLDWARNQQALVGIREDRVYIRFMEPSSGYAIVVVSSEPLALLIEFVESLGRVL